MDRFRDGLQFGADADAQRTGDVFTTLFQARVRYTGLSVAYQVSAIVGGFTPLISLTFLQQSNGAPWRVAAFLAAVGLLSFSCAAVVRSAPA